METELVDAIADLIPVDPERLSRLRAFSTATTAIPARAVLAYPHHAVIRGTTRCRRSAPHVIADV